MNNSNDLFFYLQPEVNLVQASSDEEDPPIILEILPETKSGTSKQKCAKKVKARLFTASFI